VCGELLRIERYKLALRSELLLEELGPSGKHGPAGHHDAGLEALDTDEDHHGNDNFLTNEDRVPFAIALVILATIDEKTCHPWHDACHVLSVHAFVCDAVHVNEDDGKEDDIRENKDDNGDTAPLKPKHLADALVNSSCRVGAEAGVV